MDKKQLAKLGYTSILFDRIPEKDPPTGWEVCPFDEPLGTHPLFWSGCEEGWIAITDDLPFKYPLQTPDQRFNGRFVYVRKIEGVRTKIRTVYRKLRR